MANYIMAAVLLVVSILFFKNNGDLMIPGVQNKSPEEISEYKEQFDVLKMCKLAGLILLISSLLIGFAGYLKNQYFTYGILLALIIMLTIVYNIFRTGLRKK